jgi:hypothetical protein
MSSLPSFGTFHQALQFFSAVFVLACRTVKILTNPNTAGSFCGGQTTKREKAKKLYSTNNDGLSLHFGEPRRKRGTEIKSHRPDHSLP